MYSCALKASSVFLSAEEEALRVPEQYSAAAADAISFGTFMKVMLASKDSPGGTLAKMLSWLYTNAEFSAAALATELSVTRWSDDDQFGFSGDHVWLPGVHFTHSPMPAFRWKQPWNVGACDSSHLVEAPLLFLDAA
jgi:hypothetical protein